MRTTKMSSRDELIARIEALKDYHPQKDLRDPRLLDLVQEVASAGTSLPDDGRFLAELLEKEYDALGNGGDLLVCAALRGAIVGRKIQEAVPVLNRMLLDPRTMALHEDLAETLGRMGDESSLPFLVKAIESPEVWVRAKSAESLGRLGVQGAVGPLLSLLQDDSDNVREYAIEALAGMRASEAVKPLIALAVTPEEGSWIRSTAIRALGQMRAVEAGDLLRKLRDQEDHRDVKKAAAKALAALNDSK